MDYGALAQKFGGQLVEQQQQNSPQQEQSSPQWANDLSRKDQAEIKIKMNQEGRKRLATLQSDISDGGAVMNDLNEFSRLNHENSTGSWWQQMTPDKQMFRTDGSMQMSAIQSRLAPNQRPVGSGSSSDRDVSLFLKGLPSISNYGDVNEGIREDFKRKYDEAIQKSNAMRAHLDSTGNLLDFDSQWAQRKSPSTPPAGAPKDAVNMLKMNPKLADDYDKKYGAGSSAKVLGR